MSRCTCFSSDWCDFHMRVSFWPQRFAEWEEQRRIRQALRTPEAQAMIDRDIMDLIRFPLAVDIL